MHSFRMISFVALIALLVLSAAPADAQKKKKKSPTPPGPVLEGVDSETVAAYEKIGAKYGIRVQTNYGIVFQARRGKNETALPIFRFESASKDKLPDVVVPFGIDLTKSDVKDEGLKDLGHLTNLTALHLESTKVTLAGIKELAPLKNLTLLDMNSILVSDEGLRLLREIGLLHALNRTTGNDGLRPKSNDDVIVFNLFNTRVTDEGVKEVTAFKNLATLFLGGPKVTDAGLMELATLKNLTDIQLGTAKVTPAGIKEFQAALPMCRIRR